MNPLYQQIWDSLLYTPSFIALFSTNDLIAKNIIIIAIGFIFVIFFSKTYLDVTAIIIFIVICGAYTGFVINETIPIDTFFSSKVILEVSDEDMLKIISFIKENSYFESNDVEHRKVISLLKLNDFLINLYKY